MIPGFLINLQSTSIDYDAVAYRTSVILAEDPGWPFDPAWEQKRESRKNEIERLGLSISSETPNILSREKIEKFFNQKEGFEFTPDDYRQKAIFGEIPYSYNISLRVDGENAYFTGQPLPEVKYGYMKRLVKIKDYSRADVSSGNYNQSHNNITSIDTTFVFNLSYSEIYDREISPAYRIQPKYDPITFTINDFSESLNQSDITNVIFKNAYFVKDGVIVNRPYNIFENNTYLFYIDGVQHKMADTIPDMEDKSTISYTLRPPLLFSSEVNSELKIVFAFKFNFVDDDSVQHYYISTEDSGGIPYGYGYPYMTDPNLKNGVLEVCIW
ncbi:hypothetical protein F1737_08510 [Methanoplanus sp. FWC-SCC4]|uniref:Uncharacterized protein n=1 Tax=Methanochimaera problematica TaxID=2609417 RepID=A0AA97FED5_9EURY|nr:hypothetical protein [Methanoplanus sp. FWC-SCC4]WOF16728.1 hypothetical protein F1737_08510 [Methanoplanus sp. FWC-SCC4]